MAGLAVGTHGLEVTAPGAIGGASLNSPHFTGVPTGPTAAVGTNTTQLATTAFTYARPLGWTLATDPQWGAKCNGVIVSDGVMALNSPTLTSASNGFAAAVAGMSVRVQFAGNAGGTLDLNTTILSVTNAGSITLNANCLNSSGVSGVTVYFGNDDATPLTNAIAAKGHVRVPAGSTIVLSHVTPAALAALDLTGVTVLHIPTLNNAVIKYTHVQNTDMPAIDRFTLIGGWFPGTGGEASQHVPVNVMTLTNLTIRDTIVTGNASMSFYMEDCTNVRVLNTTTVTTVNTSNTNIINFFQLTSGTIANSPANLHVIGNYVSCVKIACVDITGNVNTNGSNQSLPTNAVWIGNILSTTGFACISLESGGSTTTFYVQQAVLALNVCKQSNAVGSSTCIVSEDDGSPSSSDSFLHSYIVIALNTCSTARDGITANCSNHLIANNVIDLGVQSGTGNGVKCVGTNNARGQNNTIQGNLILMGTTGATGVYCFKQTSTDVIDNRIIWGSTTTTVTGNGFGVYIQSCIDTTVRGGSIKYSPSYGVEFDTCTDCMAEGVYILNPCCNSTQVSALNVVGAGSGAIVVKNCHFYDNRGGGALVTHAINNSGTVATCYTGLNTSIGHTGTATAGTWTSLTTF